MQNISSNPLSTTKFKRRHTTSFFIVTRAGADANPIAGLRLVAIKKGVGGDRVCNYSLGFRKVPRGEKQEYQRAKRVQQFQN